MVGIVMLYLTRHGESIGNYYHTNSSQKPHLRQDYLIRKHESSFALTPNGIMDILKRKENKLNLVNNVDYIFTSPLKRAIQTCLYTHTRMDYPIYVLSLITEYDSIGEKIENIKKDVDLFCFQNFENIDFNTYFGAYNRHHPFGEWWKHEFICQENLPRRINLFKEFLKNPLFTNKTLSFYTHAGFILGIFGICVNNYDTIRVCFNQETGTFFDAYFMVG